MFNKTITDFDQLLDRIRSYSIDPNLGLVRKAYEFSAIAHAGQSRLSGEPYLQHPLAVAGVLASLKADVTAIVAGLLHDILEDTVATVVELEKEFGKDVVHLVNGVTKIGKITFRSYEEKQAENFRKMLLSMADDIRVVLIKLADRLHNMRTLQYLGEVKRQEIAQETLEIYVPLANRLGIGWIKNELEDLCFKHLKGDLYESLRVRVAKRDEDRQQYVDEVTQLIKNAMWENGVAGQVYGRPKHLYGIYQKMNKRSITFEEIYDLTALRIVTDRKMSCYGALGVIHSLWQPVPGRFKDYIAIPKSNLYQSLHTTVVTPNGGHVEFQIRTEEMHHIAEHGIAAHWKYKEEGHTAGGAVASKAFDWLQQFVEWHEDLADNQQFMETVKLDFSHDVVYVFTPKRIVKELPKGSTPIDFAFAIHTEIGVHCVGAKVDGKIVSLQHLLTSGDTVEILTSPIQTPHKDWLKSVRTSRAKTKIKHWIKLEEQKRSMEIGYRLLESAFYSNGISPDHTFKSIKLLEVARQSGLGSTDELIAAIGFGRITTSQVTSALMPLSFEPQEAVSTSSALSREVDGGANNSNVLVKGDREVLMQLSSCCQPVPGDRILGYITFGQGLMIHILNCPDLVSLDYDKERLVKVEWDVARIGTHPVTVLVVAADKTGFLASVSSVIAACHANISRADIATREDGKAVLEFTVEIFDTQQLDQVLKAIEGVDGVITARRRSPWQK